MTWHNVVGLAKWQWTMENVIERLEGIRQQEVRVAGAVYAHYSTHGTTTTNPGFARNEAVAIHVKFTTDGSS